ncbi:uncharacterized protein LOC115073611 [Rhinatrema bivittatum]|uniref:uncharacterized protein LOC115073611 n=1 Tax=Rhinatrema bivittatum TaxID=194408 RepID=UPI00112D98D5|nr:uncharacterized protein LOC115073611 [Rhinatrema bivittatum]
MLEVAFLPHTEDQGWLHATEDTRDCGLRATERQAAAPCCDGRRQAAASGPRKAGSQRLLLLWEVRGGSMPQTVAKMAAASATKESPGMAPAVPARRQPLGRMRVVTAASSREGKLEDDEKRIQGQIEKESKAQEENLSRLAEEMTYRQSGFKRHEQRSEVLQDLIEIEDSDIMTDEVKDVEEKFKELLIDNQIQEDTSMASCDIREHMETLQHHLLGIYYAEKNLSHWSLSSLIRTLTNQNLSLRETLSLLQTVIQLKHEKLDIVKLLPSSTEIDDKSSCIIHIIHILYKTNKTLAWKLSRTVFSELSSMSQDYLSQILFNGIWTPIQAVIFSLQVPLAINSQEKVERILQKAQTYHIDAISATAALKEGDPLDYIQIHVKKEKDKNTQTILDEMRANKYPEEILRILEPVLQSLESQIPQNRSYINKKLHIHTKKKDIKSLDFANPDQENLIQIILSLSEAVQDVTTIVTKSGEKIEGYLPTLTQLAALVTLLLSETQESSGCLLEIATGEGKSTIVAMLALIHAIRGKKVDVITSNPVLARRDKEDWEKLFKIFGVSCSVIPPPGLEECTNSQQRDKAIRKAYKADIVYGTVSNFAADILRQEFEKTKTRGDRPFDVAIVDEVDYMTLDSGVQVTYLSHAATGMRHLEQVLAAIWAKVCTCQQIEDAETGERVWLTGAQYFHKAAVTAVMGSETSEHLNPQDILVSGLQLGFFTEEDIKKLASKVNEPSQESQDSEIKEIMNKLEPSQLRDLLTVFQVVLEDTVLFECYKVQNGKAVRCDANATVTHDNKIHMLLLEHGLACLMITEDELITATVDQIKSIIRFSNDYIPREKEEKMDENFLMLPGFLKEYTNNRLRVFVENALKAILMMNNREYMIDSAIDPGKDKTVSESQEYDGIIPVDFRATGILEKNKRWGDGLQQFLEMKHQLAISPLTNVTNFMSNFHFFQRYTKGTGIFGVSGTLGDEAEKEFLRKHFKTSCFPIPTHRHTKRVELPPIQVKRGRGAWIKKICDCVKERTSEKEWIKGQAVLVICEDVRTADEVQKKLLEYEIVPSSDKLTMYTRSDKHNVEDKIFIPGDVVIATNLGGRGTDFKMNKDVNESGGLCVILTHFPKNMRVEKQIFGRTARKGNPGMVQMVLNYEDLAPSYQDQPIEIMRQLRADNEKRCIADMENDELLQVSVREVLFNIFCNLLNEFDNSYSKDEKLDIFTCSDRNRLRTIFGSYKDKMDFKPALNALKETWSLWLTLREKDIENHMNLDQLKNDLSHVVKRKIDEVLKGNSSNFYDFTKLALDRMYLLTMDKSNDYGALKYWEKVKSTDPVYRAVSLYNQAYITVILRKNGYIQRAIDLLNETKKTMDIYISELTNTTVACQMSCLAKFEPHCKETTNFTKQMQTRSSLFQSWINYIDKSVAKLLEIQKAGENVITEGKGIFSLCQDYDYITTNELSTLYDMGLAFVFEVEKKPEFCIDAMICAILGALQILAGGLVLVLSLGTATQFGMGLIMEGVSDLIEGIIGMATGSFSWVQWAICKAISIGISLLTAGFSVIKRGVTTVKSLMTGSKSFASVAGDVIRSGRVTFNSVRSGVTVVSSVTKQSLSQSMSLTVRKSFIHATKYAGQEIVIQGVMTVLEFGVEKGLQEAFQAIFEKMLRDSVSVAIRENPDLKKYLTSFILVHSVPESVLKKLNQKTFTIPDGSKVHMKSIVQTICKLAAEDVGNDFATLDTVAFYLKSVKSLALAVMKKAKAKKAALKVVSLAAVLGECSLDIINMVQHFPTKDIIDKRIAPFIAKQIDANTNKVQYKEEDWIDDPDVQTLQEELLSTACHEVSQQLMQLITNHLAGCLNKLGKNVLGEKVAETVGNIVGRQKTERFFVDQRHGKKMKKITPGEGKQKLTETQQKDFDEYVKKLQEETRPATELDLNILTKSNLMQGETIRILVVDEKGKKLSTETYPGKDSSAGTITLQLTKVREQTGSDTSVMHKLKSHIKGEESSYSGHFSVVQSDGTLINSDNTFSLYSALAAANGATMEADIRCQACELKSKVHNEISQNTQQYQDLIKRQMKFEKIWKTSGKYTMQGNATTEEVSQDHSTGGQVGPHSSNPEHPQAQPNVISTHTQGIATTAEVCQDQSTAGQVGPHSSNPENPQPQPNVISTHTQGIATTAEVCQDQSTGGQVGPHSSNPEDPQPQPNVISTHTQGIATTEEVCQDQSTGGQVGPHSSNPEDPQPQPNVISTHTQGIATTAEVCQDQSTAGQVGPHSSNPEDPQPQPNVISTHTQGIATTEEVSQDQSTAGQVGPHSSNPEDPQPQPNVISTHTQGIATTAEVCQDQSTAGQVGPHSSNPEDPQPQPNVISTHTQGIATTAEVCQDQSTAGQVGHHSSNPEDPQPQPNVISTHTQGIATTAEVCQDQSTGGQVGPHSSNPEDPQPQPNVISTHTQGIATTEEVCQDQSTGGQVGPHSSNPEDPQPQPNVISTHTQGIATTAEVCQDQSTGGQVGPHSSNPEDPQPQPNVISTHTQGIATTAEVCQDQSTAGQVGPHSSNPEDPQPQPNVISTHTQGIATTAEVCQDQSTAGQVGHHSSNPEDPQPN